MLWVIILHFIFKIIESELKNKKRDCVIIRWNSHFWGVDFHVFIIFLNGVSESSFYLYVLAEYITCKRIIKELFAIILKLSCLRFQELID
jgi:hypothetical protein